ncbi:MAG: PIN domain-containing protein [Candidatus Methanoperedens sp.]|nr:PIN domain-containing protein [Candidatus Methanoperedens sp.]CAG0959113.1 23S rRNA-specific endonuclease VapC20 [Methanosarcinales archaeon]
MIFVDTSAFLALVNEKDANHAEAVHFLEQIKNGRIKVRKIITSDYIIDETLTRIRYSVGHKEAVEWGKDILGSNVVERLEVGIEMFELAWKLFQTYEDKKLSFTDCTSFAIMKKKGIDKAFSFDEDFVRIGFVQLP